MCNIAYVDLQPADLVSEFSLRNGEALSQIHELFADIVPQIFAEMEPRHPDGRIHGGIFSGNVRDAFLVELQARAMSVAGLTAKEHPFRSVRFRDELGWPCRVHMHPKSLRTGRYISTTPRPEPLFGAPLDGMELELAVLWRPSPRTKSLKSITLAAVWHLADRNQTVIFASSQLPPIGMHAYWLPEVTEQYFAPADDFDDYFNEDESFGDEPA